ncbi:hypothetical protein CHS0354_022313 [Potamilus streckersoni]|uniref:GDNF/GAS1 domain-containing protein n=1 Tax=Potamilus streckersoni TaxID=2493646 RepID=A0AAE0THV1_9BIVA|nr:hypothetical protein CHS0354_022313 [Potamilus streckersoni]
MLFKVCWILVACVSKSILTDSSAASDDNTCSTVQNKCASRVGCGMALHNFFIGCHSVIYGETDICTVQCQRALISLLSTEDKVGLAFMNCECDNNEFCNTRKQRVQICTKDVLDAMESVNYSTTVVSCTLAQWICEADTSCYTALRYYVSHCGQLIDGHVCTSRCNNSLDILYRQDKATQLISCTCDGSEDYDCIKLRRNTERLCFNRDVPYHSINDDDRNGARSLAMFVWSVSLEYLVLFALGLVIIRTLS